MVNVNTSETLLSTTISYQDLGYTFIFVLILINMAIPLHVTHATDCTIVALKIVVCSMFIILVYHPIPIPSVNPSSLTQGT